MALTKKLIFTSDVLDILRHMIWSPDGTKGTIPFLLERSQYEALNKALSTMGGKWNRATGAHIFAIDPRPQVEGLLESGSLTVERDGFFETPEPVVKRMLELVPIINSDSIILEPSAGMGAILKVILDHANLKKCEIYVIEKNENRRAFLKKEFCKHHNPMLVMDCDDFMKYSHETAKNNKIGPGFPFDLIYMNPPFEENQDIDHVMHAYYLLAEHGSLVAVMSEGPFFRTDRVAVDFRNWLSLIGGESEKLPADSFKVSGTGVNTRLVIIHK
jgi:hypothetical protein